MVVAAEIEADVLKKSFKPIINNKTKVLILGSMPSEKSLEANQYYAFKHNKFWKIMHKLIGVDEEQTYALRCEKLLQSGIGLWDVISTCERKGSLDSAIVMPKPNDFKTLLQKYNSLQAICFNGQKAHTIFARNFISKRSLNYLPELEKIALHKLPSTSPAHASLKFEGKLKCWQIITQYLD